MSLKESAALCCHGADPTSGHTPSYSSFFPRCSVCFALHCSAPLHDSLLPSFQATASLYKFHFFSFQFSLWDPLALLASPPHQNRLFRPSRLLRQSTKPPETSREEFRVPPVVHSSPQNPLNPYFESKAEGEPLFILLQWLYKVKTGRTKHC